MATLITLIHMSTQGSRATLGNRVEYTLVLPERMVLPLKVFSKSSYYIGQFKDGPGHIHTFRYKLSRGL